MGATIVLQKDGSLLIEITQGSLVADRSAPFLDGRGLNVPISVEPASRDSVEKTVRIISNFVREYLNGSLNDSSLESLSQRVYQSVRDIRVSVEAEAKSPERDRVWAKTILAGDQRVVTDAEFESAVLVLQNLSESGDQQAKEALSSFLPAVEALRRRERGQSR